MANDRPFNQRMFFSFSWNYARYSSLLHSALTLPLPFFHSSYCVYALCTSLFLSLCGSTIQTRGPGGAGLLPAPLAVWNSPLAVGAQESGTGPGGQGQVRTLSFSIPRSRISTRPCKWLPLITGLQLPRLFIVSELLCTSVVDKILSHLIAWKSFLLWFLWQMLRDIFISNNIFIWKKKRKHKRVVC